MSKGFRCHQLMPRKQIHFFYDEFLELTVIIWDFSHASVTVSFGHAVLEEHNRWSTLVSNTRGSLDMENLELVLKQLNTRGLFNFCIDVISEGFKYVTYVAYIALARNKNTSKLGTESLRNHQCHFGREDSAPT